MRFFCLFLIIAVSGCQSTPGPSNSVFDSPKKQLLDQHAGEGPAWHPTWGLLFSGGGQITRLIEDNKSEIFRKDAGSNGLLVDAQKRLLICEPVQRRVSRLSVNGDYTVLTDHYQGHRYNQPNDITVDSHGRIYFSDPRYGSRGDMQILDDTGRPIEGVYRIDLDGTVTRIITHEVDRPNGLLISQGDRFLYVADNNNNEIGGARKLWRFELATDGSVRFESKKLIYDWQTGRGPDGMALDQLGRLYVAGGRTQANLPAETAAPFLGGVYVFSPDGQFLEFVAIPNDEVTNCSFGGPDLKDLYITAGGTLWTLRSQVPGELAWRQ